MEMWKRVWRQGVVPQLSCQQLKTLQKGLETDDPRLLQGATVSPPPLRCVEDWICEGACFITYCFAFDDTDSPRTVGESEEFFARTMYAVDQAMEEPAACRHFLLFADEYPRDEVRRELLAEVKLALAGKEQL